MEIKKFDSPSSRPLILLTLLACLVQGCSARIESTLAANQEKNLYGAPRGEDLDPRFRADLEEAAERYYDAGGRLEGLLGGVKDSYRKNK